MSNKEKIDIDVNANVTIPDKTVERCLRLIEMWMDDNPDKRIIVEKIACIDGFYHKMRIETPELEDGGVDEHDIS